MGILITGTDVNQQPTATPWKISLSKTSPEYLQKIKKGEIKPIEYKMDEEEYGVYNMILKDFSLGYISMYKPRVEFNDLSVISRMQTDQMSFNTYQPNNGEGFEGDEIQNWRSNAMRPIVRNKCISIAAHATARLIFPKIFAYNQSSDEDNAAANVMESLMEYAGDKSNYEQTSLHAVITALTDPVSLVYSEYAEVYRTVKRPTEKPGEYVEENILDEELSGFQDLQVPCDEVFIKNFYEPNWQKQPCILWRRVIDYSLAEAKYHNNEKFRKYVRPGVQVIYNDANSSFYQVYDSDMRQEDVEEIIYWNRQLDLKIVIVNGVMLTPHDNPNPRQDKQYPFSAFGYEMINSRCAYFKSLAFKLQQDANIINTLYPMVIDGTYLNVMPPMVAIGQEAIGSDVIVPGAVSTFKDPNADLKPITAATNIKTGMETMMKVEESLNASSQDPIQQGQAAGGSQTAFEISRLEENANKVLGLFVKSISSFVKQYGKLRLSDILQFLTIGEAKQISGPLVYQTFLIPDKNSDGNSTKKIQFDLDMPTELTEKEALQESYKIRAEEKSKSGGNVKLWKANPEKFRNNKYHLMVTPDVLNPRSEDLERAYSLEIYDRAIANQTLDQNVVTKEFLLTTNPRSKKDPEKFMNKQPASVPVGLNVPGQPSPGAAPDAPGTAMMRRGMPYQSPLASAMKQKNTSIYKRN